MLHGFIFRHRGWYSSLPEGVSDNHPGGAGVFLVAHEGSRCVGHDHHRRQTGRSAGSASSGSGVECSTVRSAREDVDRKGKDMGAVSKILRQIVDVAHFEVNDLLSHSF